MRGMTQAEMRREYLSPKRETELARSWLDHQDQNSLDRLVNAHHKLAVRAVYQICKTRDHKFFQDMVQEAEIGLMQAAQKFDPDHGNRFSTYANWWIKAQLQDFLMRNWSLVRGGTSAAQKTAYFAVRRLSITASLSDVRPVAELEEIARRTGIPLKDVDNLYNRVVWGDFSMNTKIRDSENDQDFMETFIDPAPLPEEVVLDKLEQERARSLIETAMGALNPREQYVFRHRRLHEDGPTLHELSLELKVSRERIRQIEVRALEKFTDEIHRLMPTARRREMA